MVTGRVDFILERLGRNHGMPRGFPVLWWPGRRIQIFGFRPKFANDVSCAGGSPTISTPTVFVPISHRIAMWRDAHRLACPTVP